MPDAPQKTIAPPTGELAAPERYLGLSSTRAAPYTELIEPNDQILQSKGGVANIKVYKELLRDDQVRSTFQQRRLSLISAETMVDPGADDPLSKQAAEALQEELRAIAWDDITEKMLYATFYGWSVAEIMWRPEGDRVRFDNIIVRARERFRFDVDGRLHLEKMHSMGAYVQMPERKFWTISTGADNDDEPYGLGLAHSLYWPCYFKRNDIKFWLIFLERFGQPTATAKLPAGMTEDPQLVAKAIALLKSITTDAGVVVPDNITIELLEAARSGAADYASMRAAMDGAIAKIVLSQTMTTDNGSSRSQAEVHMSVRDEVVAADSDLICESFNRGPATWWTEWNFPGAVPPRVWRNTRPPEDLNQRAERDKKVAELGYEPTEDYVRETYGEGWVKKKVVQPPAMRPGLQPNPDDPDVESDPQFAEAAALAALKAARRGDQQALVDAAARFASQYETLMGRRIAALLDAAEFADDYETFRRRLDEILAEEPEPETTDKLVRASIFARLLGIARTQRR